MRRFSLRASLVVLVAAATACPDASTPSSTPDAAVLGDADVTSDASDAVPEGVSETADAPTDTPSDTPVDGPPDAADAADAADDAPAADGDASQGNVINATSCAQPDVEAALAAASPGDTVQVPAGTCAWSGLVLEGVHLRGSGPAQTIITVDNVQLRKHSSAVTRISRFGFEKLGGGNQSKGFEVSGTWRGAELVVVQDNTFTIDNTGLFVLRTAGGVVIARNAFSGGWDDSFIQPKDTGDPDGSWTEPDTFGDRDTDGMSNHYVEDNTFIGGTNQGIDADDATRVVYRNNTLTNSSFNTHGQATSSDGVRHVEVYDNVFVHTGDDTTLANQNWLIWLRGGTAVIFGNTFADIAGSHWGDKPEIRLTIRGAEDARPQGDCANVSYPVPRQLGQSHDGQAPVTDPIYLWNNSGAQVVSAGWNWGNPCNLTFDDYLAFGRDVIDDGTPRPGYAPYAYPHPAVLASP